MHHNISSQKDSIRKKSKATELLSNCRRAWLFWGSVTGEIIHPWQHPRNKNIFLFQEWLFTTSGIDSVVTAWLLHGMRITAQPQQRCEVSYFNGESGSPEVTEPFCFGCGLAVYCVLQVPWIKHSDLLEEAPWLGGQLSNCSRRIEEHPIRRSAPNRCCLMEKAAGAR